MQSFYVFLTLPLLCFHQLLFFFLLLPYKVAHFVKEELTHLICSFQFSANINEVWLVFLILVILGRYRIENKLFQIEFQVFPFKVEASIFRFPIRYCQVVTSCFEYSLHLLHHHCNIYECVISTENGINSRFVYSHIKIPIRVFHVAAIHYFVHHFSPLFVSLSHLFYYYSGDVNIVEILVPIIIHVFWKVGISTTDYEDFISRFAVSGNQLFEWLVIFKPIKHWTFIFLVPFIPIFWIPVVRHP